MEFPKDNQIHTDPVQTAVESNAEILQEHLKRINWRFFGRAVSIVWGTLLIMVFTLIVIVKLALSIF